MPKTASLITEQTKKNQPLFKSYLKRYSCLERLWQNGPYGAKTETEKSAKSPSTKNTKCLCKSTCYAITNLELTSSHILFLATKPEQVYLYRRYETPRKQKDSAHNCQFTSRLLSSQIMPPELDTIASMYRGLLQVYGNVNRTTWEDSKSSGLYFA